MTYKYSKEDVEFMKANAHKGRKWLAEAMNRSEISIKGAMFRNNIKTGRNTRFQRGLNPWNAGRVGVRMSPKSEFKKGQMPYNTLYDGAITVRSDRNSKTGKIYRYKYIRIANAKWLLYQRYVWEQHNGPVPPKHLIKFKNGDTLDCRLENLEMISMAENARRNRNPEKYRKTIKLLMEEGEHPSKHLTDNYIIGNLSKGNIKLKDQIKRQPELIELKRNQLILRRHINGKS